MAAKDREIWPQLTHLQLQKHILSYLRKLCFLESWVTLDFHRYPKNKPLDTHL
ncbi:MAG: hypothetical protein WBG02_02560 [Candidatus Acidiferrum sp.]